MGMERKIYGNLTVLETMFNSNTNSVFVVAKDNITGEIKTFIGAGSYPKCLDICPEAMMMLGALPKDDEELVKYVIDNGLKIGQKQMIGIYKKYIPAIQYESED